MDAIISNLFGREYHLSTTRVEALGRGNFDVVFWLLIALVILMILAILALLFYCCCIRTPEGSRDVLELKNKIVPEDNVITYRENGAVRGDKDTRRRSNSVTREAWSSSRRPSKVHKRSLSAVDVDVQTSQPQTANAEAVTRNGPADRLHQRDGGLPPEFYTNGVPGGRMDRAYRHGRPFSPHTEMFLQDIEAQDARRVGDYMVVRKVVRPRVRVEGSSEQGDDTVPKRTEILYIRSPLREEDEFVRGEGDQLRSVSETALNIEEPNMATLRVPRTLRPRQSEYPRNEGLERLEGPPSQQLKFSRYHRTDSDVYLTNDGQVVNVPPDQLPQWLPASDFRDRAGRQGWSDRWDHDEAFHRQPQQRLPSEMIDYNGIPRGERIRMPPPPPPQQQSQTQPLIPQQQHQQYPSNHPTHHVPHPQFHHSTEQNTIQQGQYVRDPHQNQFEELQQSAQQPSTSHPLEYLPTEQSQSQQQELASPKHEPTPMPQEGYPQRRRQSLMPQDAEITRSYRRRSTDHSIKLNMEDNRRMSKVEDEMQKDMFERRATDEDLSKVREIRDSVHPSIDSGDVPVEEGPIVNGHETPTEDEERPQTVILNSSRELADDSNRLDDDQDHKDDVQTDEMMRRTTEDDLSRTDHLATDVDGEDSDSGIGKDGSGLRLKKANLMEKKSLFTIAYDGMQTRGLKSAGDRDDSP